MVIPSITRTPVFKMTLGIPDSIIEIDDAVEGAPVTGLAYTFAPLTLSSVGERGRVGGLVQSMAALVLSASHGTNQLRGTLAQTLDDVALSAAGATGPGTPYNLAIDETGAFWVDELGNVMTDGLTSTPSGALTQTLGALALSAAGISPKTGALAKTLGALTLSADGGAPGQIGALAQTLGALTVLASHGSNQLRGALAQTLGSQTLVAAGVGPGGAWTPASLTSLAAWYDPSDLATLWQDSAQTTPVTASGQYVGYIADKSGNAYHLSQATAGMRPQLLTSGTGKLYLNFAAGQSLTIGANSLFNNRTAICAGAAIQSTSGGMIHAIQHSTGSDACEFSYSNNGVGYELSGRRLPTDGFSVDAVGTADTTLRTIIAHHDYAAALATIYVDGTIAVGPGASQTAGSTPAVNGNGNAMGGWPGGGYHVSANVYQLVLSWGATAGEIASLNTFLTSKR